MKRLLLVLTLILAIIPTPTTQASHPQPSQKSYLLPAVAAVGGLSVFAWVAKHYWDKHNCAKKVEAAQACEQTYSVVCQKPEGAVYKKIAQQQNGSGNQQAIDALVTEQHMQLRQGLYFHMTKLDMKNHLIANRFREQYKWASLGLGATGLGVAAWGVQAMLATK